jgi:hypothetical protein
MVWNQYVYEATSGNDVDIDSDVELYEDDIELTVEDWEIEYSGELTMMWDTIRTLMYDAHIEHSGRFCDFVEFCYIEHYTYADEVVWEHDEYLVHIWKSIRRIVNNNGLHEVMMRGAKFNHFIGYVKNYMCIH